MATLRAKKGTQEQRKDAEELEDSGFAVPLSQALSKSRNAVREDSTERATEVRESGN